MELPLPLKKFGAQALKLPIEDVLFSRRTYQIQVDGFWVLLQFETEGLIDDWFCSCQGEEEAAPCVHAAAAILNVYEKSDLPLHIRYESSFWKALALICFEKKGKGVEIRGADFLKRKEPETEENSIKFSNLSEEELEAWQKGHPSPELAFELSFLGDLSKWFFEQHDPSLTFSSDKAIPTEIVARHGETEWKITLKKEDWISLIPTLPTVKAPLTTYCELEDSVEKVEYKEGVLHFTPKAKQVRKGEKIGDWIFDKGFYPIEKHALLVDPHLSEGALGKALTEYGEALQRVIPRPRLSLKPIHPHFKLTFDSKWRLHIQAYVQVPGDILRTFGDWAEVADVGIVRILGRRPFEEEIKNVPQFLQNERDWLDQIDGFKFHLAGIEAEIDYAVNGKGELHFSRHVPQHAHDFGSWIYVEGQGFYAKINPPVYLPFKDNFMLRPDQVAGFIHQNEAELKILPRFFLPECPVEEAGLHVKLQHDSIEITPTYRMKTEAPYHFYDEVLYVQGEGFCILSGDKWLPESLREERHISKKQVEKFVRDELSGLKSWILDMDPRLERPALLQLHVDAIQTEGFQFALRVHYKTEKGEISVFEVWKAIQSKSPFFFHPAGLLDLSDPRFEWLQGVSVDAISEGHVTLNMLELMYLEATETIPTTRSVREILANLHQLKAPDLPIIQEMKGTLRPYQEKGVHWLWFLYRYGLSGLLCDDMGLGKTHQAMALMGAIRHLEPTARFLIICPTSVLYHWQEKLAAYLPGATVQLYHGVGRSTSEVGRADILLTSYGIWRNEHNLLRQLPFQLAVFDELQIAKNHTSRLYQALQKVNTPVRLGLTGTPIENRLRELKALFDLILPSYMPKESVYMQRFVKPIEKENLPEARQKLQRLIRPFVLRRKKEEVLTDLPEKVEEVLHCDLHASQHHLYMEVLRQRREALVEELRNSSKPAPYLHIFALLSHLKQICNHPALFYKKVANYRKYHSGKWDLFLELLHEAFESDQKVVVYSQYLGMLDIIEDYLKEHHISYASIRGATQNRGEEVSRFQNDHTCKVFVGSLRAAGLGIDLTAASVVIHYDRWWNAAREDQATDRVHRIGQVRNVQVFKLVTKGTFEERIATLINRKAQLMDDVIGVDDHNILKSFNREELLELLSDVDIDV